jgi:hypothetical protein
MATTSVHPKQGELAVQLPYVDAIFELVSSNRIDEARRVLATAIAAGESTGELARWARVLAPPAVVISSTEGPDRTVDYGWLRKNSQNYSDTWVAILDGDLLAHSARLRDVLHVVRARGVENRALIHRIA